MSDAVLVELHEVTFGTLEPADDVVTIVASAAFGQGGGSDSDTLGGYARPFMLMGA